MPLRALHGARELCRLCAKELPDRASPALAGSRSQVWTLQTVSEGQELQTRQFEVSKYNYHYLMTTVFLLGDNLKPNFNGKCKVC